MAIKTKRMSDWLAQNGEAITAASKASMLKAVNDEVAQLYDGIYIVAFFYNKLAYFEMKYWNANLEAIGVLVVSGGHSLIMATKNANLPFSSGYSNVDVPLAKDINSATKDMSGKENTAKIIAASNENAITNTESYAAGFCNNYSAIDSNGNGINAGKWWLPSCGELLLILKNRERINYVLSVINSSYKIPEGNIYTSTPISNAYTWYFENDVKKFSASCAYHRLDPRYVIPITSIS